MKIFYGEVHSHTNLSDGKGLVENAYPYARDIGGVDYFAVTDHNTLTKDDYIPTVAELADRYCVDLPICRGVYQVLYEGRDLREGLDALFKRSLKDEF
jgi:hypothetical protein